MDTTLQNLEETNSKLAALSAQERIDWAYKAFGQGLVVSTSFGIQSAVMLHLSSQIAPKIPIIFIDTGYLFPETYRFADQLSKDLKLNLKKYQAPISPNEQEALHGKLWEQGKEGVEKYNFVRKIEPMNRALKELKANAWLAGLRKEQSSTRQKLEFVQSQNKILKVHPILDWSDRDIYNYLKQHNLPYHPLREEGYISLGDTHSTSKLLDGMNPEDTRFNGIKRECGLHESSQWADFQI